MPVLHGVGNKVMAQIGTKWWSYRVRNLDFLICLMALSQAVLFPVASVSLQSGGGAYRIAFTHQAILRRHGRPSGQRSHPAEGHQANEGESCTEPKGESEESDDADGSDYGDGAAPCKRVRSE